MRVTIKDAVENDFVLEAEMHLYLEPSGSGVVLRGIDAHGNDWFILTITKNGKIHRELFITTSSDWPITANGELKLDTE
jgi:hypothetical protein